jgi:hypothetical protein
MSRGESSHARLEQEAERSAQRVAQGTSAGPQRREAPAGEPLDAVTRREMESQLGHRFSDVRIHADTSGARTARSQRARAVTLGTALYFDAGEYEPHTVVGRTLLAHELTHVVQQRRGAVGPRTHLRQTPRAAPVDAAAQKIIDLAQDEKKPKAERAIAAVKAIIDQYYPADAPKIGKITYTADLDGLKINYKGTGAATTGDLEVGRAFVDGVVQRHFARRVAQVRHEIEHVEQVRSGMVGEKRSDEREFIAHYHGALFQELPGTGKIQHSTRVALIDGAIGYYCCLSEELQKANASRHKELVERREKAVKASGHGDLGEAPKTCKRASD